MEESSRIWVKNMKFPTINKEHSLVDFPTSKSKNPSFFVTLIYYCLNIFDILYEKNYA